MARPFKANSQPERVATHVLVTPLSLLKLQAGEFLQHYDNMWSNVETTFRMIKVMFGERVHASSGRRKSMKHCARVSVTTFVSYFRHVK
jgi:hypothetical protein